jgi:hypothetical protein
MTEQDSKIQVRVPQDRDLRRKIDSMAKFVATDGEAFEQVEKINVM